MLRSQFIRTAIFALALCCGPLLGARVLPVPVPQELRSAAYTVLIDGKPIDVAHAAASYDYVNLESTGPVKVSITAAEKDFWACGVDIQPWRLGIRPTRAGNTIEFRLSFDAGRPVKLSIGRPGDFLNHGKMLFLFMSHPAPAPPEKADALFHLVPPGVHRESMNPRSGETWYLSPGAVIFGSLNLWKVENVTVLGRGVIVYDGPQNPEDDDGWMQKPDWHCIGALEAHHIHISGVTCLVRSRTWSIQMKDSTDLVYDDLRVIGGNPGNANQDGMDWLGGGDTVVRDSFFRASDDVFALQGNWDGYEHDKLVKPGNDVANILVEHSVLSTSISNVVRAGWPEKTFNSRNFTLRDSDILHGGIGSCGPPFALFTFWGARGTKGNHSGYRFENLWLDDWYSLLQLEQDEAKLRDFTFRNIWALEQPPLVVSRISGPVEGVRVENVKLGQTVADSNAHLQLELVNDAPQPVYDPVNSKVHAEFQLKPAVLEPGTTAEFSASPVTGNHARYTWLFGDGTTAQGQHVRHRFPDALGTELDGTGAGRFRVLLHVEDSAGNQDWASQSVVVVGGWHAAQPETSGGLKTGAEVEERVDLAPGLLYSIFPGSWPDLPNFKAETPIIHDVASDLTDVYSGGFSRFAVTYDGFVEIPADGGYTFNLMARDGARLMIDGTALVQTGPPFAEVCGSPLNAVRYAHGSIGLRAGRHSFRLEALESTSPGSPRLLWEGPGMGLTDVPAKALSHLSGILRPAKQGAPISTLEP